MTLLLLSGSEKSTWRLERSCDRQQYAIDDALVTLASLSRLEAKQGHAIVPEIDDIVNVSDATGIRCCSISYLTAFGARLKNQMAVSFPYRVSLGWQISSTPDIVRHGAQKRAINAEILLAKSDSNYT